VSFDPDSVWSLGFWLCCRGIWSRVLQGVKVTIGKEVTTLAKQENINEKIRAPQVRVIGADGSQLGIIPIEKALQLAAEAQLDLVEVAPNAEPPVCKIMDYGKFKYQQNKRSQEAKKKASVIQVKEVKIRPKTDDHDLEFKIRHIRRFLAQKDKAKVTMLFRGREIVYSDLGLKILERVLEALQDEVVVEQRPKMEGRNLVMVLAPKS
jgi:translation initiation factor IF-3